MVTLKHTTHPRTVLLPEGTKVISLRGISNFCATTEAENFTAGEKILTTGAAEVVKVIHQFTTSNRIGSSLPRH